MLVYFVLGLVAPVYAGGTSGLGALFGPTGGYLWGFVVAAWLTGWTARDDRRARRLLPSRRWSASPAWCPSTRSGARGWPCSLHVGVRRSRRHRRGAVRRFECLKAALAALIARERWLAYRWVFATLTGPR